MGSSAQNGLQNKRTRKTNNSTEPQPMKKTPECGSQEFWFLRRRSRTKEKIYGNRMQRLDTKTKKPNYTTLTTNQKNNNVETRSFGFEGKQLNKK